MKIVLITAVGLEHCYVANKLSEAFNLSAIVVDLGVKQSFYGRVRRVIKRYTFVQLCSKIILKIIHIFTRESKKEYQSMVRVLGPENCLDIKNTDNVVYVRGINRHESVAIVKKYRPDLILIYGTSIIGKEIMSIPSKGILNMHTGISPYYRGDGCAFWPIYDEKLEYIGATVHECTADVDGGEIYGTVQAELKEDDNLHSVFARTVLAGTDLYITVVHQMLKGELSGLQQDMSLGKEYRASMKKWWHEIIVKNKIKRGLICRYASSGKTQE